MSETIGHERRKDGATGLRRGWTTGACATAATKAALSALLTGRFPDPVSITLPKGETPAFALCHQERTDAYALAGIIKDAGDDPDVTHLAEIVVEVRFLGPGSGIVFKAGAGVGMVTREGLPIPPGEPAINPVPRQMMRDVATELCAEHARAADVEITVSIPGGDRLAEKTWNPRLGIVGGLSILGTTGIVHPFSCASWIHAIHRGVDVARAAGLTHLVGPTGSSSEAAARALYPHLPELAFLDMGDFAGGLIKYLRTHPVERLTIAGGFAKLTKLAQGAMDLHSGRSQVDFAFLAHLAEAAGHADLARRIAGANTAKEALDLAGDDRFDLAAPIAEAARREAVKLLRGAAIAVDIVVTDRAGTVVARAG
ncbi:cobalt-precorrin-5B (C(1))-methyltransferase [Fulvimarina sp. 2208YS6-2-32]|uniref:Cobalt-precorrin-5B C(1)-methyltransferase n=1 Tax=Fulvimarina uroteuthidis TaxID=3098149 RepID=A0ABU5HXD1_9HYPH|nr:cobalt-precorrin-5B (C(1))-methyltransferase [Fulvimarina sp. 2208YS6-2-32]MDY8107791.1 cobalt-precorrin-5B (C(1))-methyltransferase [Fulvimarina sp. 2208YS6-2-32]